MALNNFLTKKKTLIFILHGFILISLSALFSCRENGPVCIVAPECRGDSAVRFAVIGDWGLWGQADQLKVAKAMDKVGSECQYDFIVSTGDNFYDAGVDSVGDVLWDMSFEYVYTGSQLQCPWYVVLGNHDYRGAPSAEMAYSNMSSRWKLPSKYFKEQFSAGGNESVEMFFMDSNPYQKDLLSAAGSYPELNGQDTVSQNGWIESGLRNSSADWKLVVGHHPLYTCGVRKNQRQHMRKFEGLFNETHVDAYFCGHEHDLQVHKPEGNVTYFVSGGGGSKRPIQPPFEFTHFAQSTLGFMVVEITNGKMTVTSYNENGQVLHVESIVH
jgi:3',5'-cyclic AMP phosphodiesterase CpdA